MSRLYFLLIILIAISHQIAIAQSYCNLSSESQDFIKQRMLNNRKSFQYNLQSRTGSSIYIPVRFWLTANDDGSKRFQEYLKLFNFFCKTNECIGDHSMIFYIKEIDESINNTLINRYPLKEGKQMLNDIINTKRDAINVIICDEADKSLVGVTSINDDYIIMNAIGVIEESRSLCHNFGHFLSLPHTCGAWLWYDCSKPTKDQIPFGRPVEYVSRSKTDSIGNIICMYAADGFCDTPADYSEFNNSISTPCNYSGCAKDPDNVQLNPNISNPMSISSNVTCSDTFTNQQKEAMLIDYLTPERDYIKVNYIPIGKTYPPKYLEPSNQSKLTKYDSIFFDWTDDPNSTDYILEIAENTKIDFKPQRFKTKQSQYLVTSLTPNTRYFWRVLAYNSNSFCDIEPIISVFTSGFLSTSVSKESDQQIQYNIFNNQNNNELTIDFYFEEDETFKFNLFDLNGKLLYNSKIQNRKIKLDNKQLKPGLYFFNVYSLTKNVLTVKLLIQ